MDRIKLNRTWRVFALALSVLGVLLACSVSGVPFISKAEPTATLRPTRTPRPTFTPSPDVTDTPVPTVAPLVPTSEPPTQAPPPTRKPAVPTRKPAPPTKPPPPPPPTPLPGPTKSPYAYSYISQTCEHSGGTYIHIRVYSDRRNPNSQQSGVKTRLSWAAGDGDIGTETTSPDGYSTFVLAGDGAPPKVGTYYAWIVDNSGSRISDVSAPVVINGKSENFPDACWQAYVNFAK